jgi:CheY-like chemotaxis protein
MTSKMVEEVGCRVMTAVDGADALNLLRSEAQKPDLILSDVEMPIMDGWEFLGSIKADPTISHIPIVMVTSLNSAEYKQKARSLGAADYLVKPFTLAAFDRVCSNMEKVKV